MDVQDHQIEQLKHEIANIRTMLKSLESGRTHMGTRRHGEPWTDTTEAWVDRLKKTLKMHQTILGSRDRGSATARPLAHLQL
jgi:hypothetical protein